MKKNLIFLIIVSFLLMGCKNKLSDPLNGFVIGSNELDWKTNLEKNLKNKEFVQGNYSNEFQSNLYVNKKIIPVTSRINFEGYPYGKLLDYEIILCGEIFPKYTDNLVKQNPNEAYKYFSFDTLRLIYESFVQRFGEPKETRDFGIVLESPDYGKDANNLISFSDKNLIAPDDWFNSHWDFKEYYINFFCGKSYYDPDSVRRIALATIDFKSINYSNELQLIKDSLVKTFSAKDYVECFMLEPVIKRISSTYEPYDRELGAYFDYIKRGANEDTRDVESFKYDAIFLDEYNTELFRIKGNNFIFQEPLIINKSNYYSMYGNRYGWTNNYHSTRTAELKQLEEAFSKGFKIRCIIEVKAVKLDDGTIIE